MASATMKACVAESGVVTVQSMPVPEPGSGQVLLQVVCSGCCGSLDGKLRNSAASTPVIVGYEGVGVVSKHGPGIDGEELPKGARVGIRLEGWEAVVQKQSCLSVNGTLAEYCVADVGCLVRIPDALSAVNATPILCAGTLTYKALKDSGLRAAQFVVINGAGGSLGHLAVQYARAMGMKVIGIDSGAAKIDVLKKLGVKHVVNSEIVKDLSAEISKITKDCWADGAVCLEPQRVAEAVEYVKPGGVIMCVALKAGCYLLPTHTVATKGIRVQGSGIGGSADMAEALEFADDGRVQCTIDVRSGLDKAQAAFDASETVPGHVVLSINPGAERGAVSKDAFLNSLQQVAAVGADLQLQNSTASISMTQFILTQSKGDFQLALLMNAIQHASKVCANAIQKAGPEGLYGLAGQENSTGDDVKKLDLIANTIWVDCLKGSGVCCLLVSEEDEEPIVIGEDKKRGPFCVAFDPLDGSSNIDCNVSVGSIFSVYRRKSEHFLPAKTEDILRPGTECIAAGYCMFGAATELVVTFGQGVHRFALDPAMGEFLFVEEMRLPAGGGKKIYSCNEGNEESWDKSVKDFVLAVKDKGYSARYVGSMVSDVHRTLLYGGIFLYPADKKSKKGKLRVLYEGFPMAMITEQAGGLASTGMFQGTIGRILEVIPEHIHDRCPIIMGGERDVRQVLALYAQSM